jgi:hypothetical protein
MKKIIALLLVSFTTLSFGKCVVVDGATQTEFSGTSLAGIQVEKKSLTALEKAFPNLKAKEKMFSGEVTVCTDCTSKHVKCD